MNKLYRQSIALLTALTMVLTPAAMIYGAETQAGGMKKNDLHEEAWQSMSSFKKESLQRYPYENEGSEEEVPQYSQEAVERTDEQEERSDDTLLIKYNEEIVTQSVRRGLQSEEKKEEAAAVLLAQDAEDAGILVDQIEPYEEGLFLSVKLESGQNMEEAIDSLENCESVEYAEPLIFYHSLETRGGYDDPVYQRHFQWGVDAVDSYALWSNPQVQENLKNVTIAILDSGIYERHEDLKESIRADGYDFVEQDKKPQDENSHGTHVAGIAAAISQNGIGIAGVAGGAQILPVRVLNSKGAGSSITVANGILYAANHGADIINLSLGSSYESRAIQDAVDYATEKGVLVIAAAGNDGIKNKINYPAASRNVLAVAALDYDGEQFVETDFSSYDAELSHKIIHAPGYRILSTGNTGNIYTYKSGTSMAAPFVAGMAALLKAEALSLSAQQLQDRVMQSTYSQERIFQNEKGKLETAEENAFMHVLNDNGEMTSKDIYNKRFIIQGQKSIPLSNGKINITAEDITGKAHEGELEQKGILKFSEMKYDSEKGYLPTGGYRYLPFALQNGEGQVTVDLQQYGKAFSYGDVIGIQAVTNQYADVERLSDEIYAASSIVLMKVGERAVQEITLKVPEGGKVPSRVEIDLYAQDNSTYLPGMGGYPFYYAGTVQAEYNAQINAFQSNLNLTYGTYKFVYCLSEGLDEWSEDYYLLNEPITRTFTQGGEAITKEEHTIDSLSPEPVEMTLLKDPAYISDIPAESKALNFDGAEAEFTFENYGQTQWMKINTAESGSDAHCAEFIGSGLLSFGIYHMENGVLTAVPESDYQFKKSAVLSNNGSLLNKYYFFWGSDTIPNGEYYVRLKGLTMEDGNGGFQSSTIKLKAAHGIKIAMDIPADSKILLFASNASGNQYWISVDNPNNVPVTGRTYILPVPFSSKSADSEQIKLEYLYEGSQSNLYSEYGCFSNTGMQSLGSFASILSGKELKEVIPFYLIKRADAERTDDYAESSVLTIGKEKKGTLSYAEDEDTFSFKIYKEGNFAFKMLSETPCDAALYQLNQTDKTLLQMWSTGGAEQWNFAATGTLDLEKGSYILEVNSSSDRTPGYYSGAMIKGGYRIQITGDPGTPAEEPEAPGSGGSSGGGGGSAGGGGAAAPSPVADGSTEKPSITKNEDGSVDVKAVIEKKESLKMSANKAVVNAISEADRVRNMQVTISSTVSKWLENNKMPLLIQGDSVAVLIPAEALKANGSSWNLSVNTKDTSVIGLINSVSPIYDIQLQAGNSKITSFAKPIQITLVYDSGQAGQSKQLGAYWNNPDTENWEYVGGSVTEAGKLSFETDHFSEFMIMKRGEVFSDIENSWAKSYIELMAEKGIIQGNQGRFMPQDKITRAEFISMIMRIQGESEGESQNIVFEDVKKDAWYAADVSAAYDKKIVKGKSDTLFAPFDSITREEVVTMLVNAYLSEGGTKISGNDVADAFTDKNKIAAWAKETVNMGVHLKLVTGNPDGTFRPADHATRAEAVVMLTQFTKLQK